MYPVPLDYVRNTSAPSTVSAMRGNDDCQL